MAPNSKITFIRHAEAMHNIDSDWTIHDPTLSPKGEEQVKTLLVEKFRTGYPFFKKAELMVVSPMVRTLQTALLGFGTEINNKDFRVSIVPQFQETSCNLCDVGSPADVLSKRFPQFTYELLGDDSYLKKDEGFYAPANLVDRATWVREWLYKRPEEYIVVVTHSGFLRHITPHDFPPGSNRDHYENCEFREFEFAEDPRNTDLGGPYKLVETDWSKELRKKKKSRLIV